MADSWRFGPIQSTICPTCSISHFPFCYQHPQFNRFPNDPPFHRPVLDHFSGNLGTPRPLSSQFENRGGSMMPFSGNPSDVYGMSQSLNRNQNFERDLFWQRSQMPPLPDSGVVNGVHRDGFQPMPGFGYGGNGFARGEFVESDRSHKRMRVGEMGSGSFGQMPPPTAGYSVNPGRMSSEDERRLNLIRDHGAPPSVAESHVNQFNGYLNERLPGQHFTESSRSDWQPRFPSNAKMNSFVDPRFGSADRMGPMLGREPGFDTQPYVMQNSVFDEKKEVQRGGHDLGFGQHQMRLNVESDVDSTVLNNRDGSGNVSPGRHIQDSSVVRGEDEHQHWGDKPFNGSQRDDLNQYSHGGYQQLLPKDFNRANELRRSHVTQPFEVKHQLMDNNKTSVGPHNLPVSEQYGVPTMNNMVLARQSQMLSSQPIGVHPLLPPLPPRPVPLDPPGAPSLHLQARSSPAKISSIYPVPPTASSPVMRFNSSAHEGQPFPLKHPSPDKPKVVDATHLFLPPYRATRPDHIVIILRGLPGSGKSYLAKMLRDLEVENGGVVPRIHSMDDYFMSEVEKVEEVDSSKSSSVAKGKKRITKKVMEYCYEPEMEEAYRSSMLKAFKKTLEEGNFTFVIVDDRNLRVADFAQFWASAKRSGYEVYLLEAMYKDPLGCAARNLHGFAADDIHKMAELWEEAPSLYLQLDVQSLFRGDNLKESEIQEVDMDMEDVTCVEGSLELSDTNSPKIKEPPVEDYTADGFFKDGRWDAEVDDPTRVKELGRSKWSHDEDEEDYERPKGAIGNSNALSGLIQAYSKGDKSVHWGDQVGKTGFSISAAKKASSLSLVIGPGAGYNLKSNPLLEEENVVAAEHGWGSKNRSVFEEQLRAERESFRAVFDRRRHRIGGLETEEE